MNSLKPLLTIAVLAGIGYGVYIRLNAGAGAPPPPVDAGWDSAPAVQLPGQNTSAPWGPPSGAVASSAPPTNPFAGGGGTPFHSSSSAAGASQAPPFGNTTEAVSEAPQYSSDPIPPVPMPNAAPQQEPSGTPPTASPADPYGTSPAADPYGAPPAGDPYRTTPEGMNDPYGAPSANGPAGGSSDQYPPSDYPLPPGAEAPVDSGGPPSNEFAAMIQAARHELENGQLASALKQLTAWYGNPQLTPAEQQQLNGLLDQVAGTVVYSTQNLLENPYEVQPGERLEAIGEKYQVPWQLLAKINGISDPASLQPGERLKVVRGPFMAVVSLERKELVLLTADGLYAGRFRIGIGTEHPPQEGTFAVSDKVANPIYYGRDRSIGAEDPSNPLGERWIGLGKEMAIHGTNDPATMGRTDLPGGISLMEPDVEEVFDILSLGSRVTIRR